jgi:hypothetical protein
MFRVVSINGTMNDIFNEGSFLVEEAFFFTIKSTSYYNVYNKREELIGVIPDGYNLFFKVEEHDNFEEIDMFNVLRLFEMGEEFQIVGTISNSQQVKLISSNIIKEFRLVDDDVINIPFTNKAFDSEGIIVFKNMVSLAESIKLENDSH